MNAGTQAFDSGDRDTAREKFTQVLQIDPHNSSAQEYMEKLSEVVTEGGAAAFASAYTPPPSAAKPEIFSDMAIERQTAETPLAPPMIAPPPRKPPSTKAAAVKPGAAAASSRGLPMKTIAIVAVIAVVVAGGWFAWSKFMSKPAYDPAATTAIFKQATTLAQRGQYDAAIMLLQDVKPDDPQHDKALSMIADLQNKKSQQSEMASGRPATVAYQEALNNGKAAFDAHDYDAAKKAFDTAAHIKPLPPDMQTLYDTAAQQVAKLQGAKSLFNEQKYQEALTNLQSLAQQDPQNQSIKRLITDAHFNLGALALQEERLPDAIKEFDEVLKSDPSDELAKRSKALAERYKGQDKDLLY